MDILIVGCGWVGLVAGNCFADVGHRVICLDVDEKRVDQLMKGKVPIYEPGLEEIFKRNLIRGNLSFTTNYEQAVKSTSICFLAVNTPSDEVGRVDLTALQSAVSSIAKYMDGYRIVINKSTSPVGTAQAIARQISHILEERCVDYPFDVVSNPEFLKEGQAISDFMKPHRVVVGIDNPRVISLLEKLYAPFMVNHKRLLIMDSFSAEMTKYAANAMLALRVSFMNELAGLCELAGADIMKVRVGIGSDKRIGYDFLYPGVGFGGSCLPKDLKALRFFARSFGYQTPVLNATSDVNVRQKRVLTEKIRKYFEKKGGLSQKAIAILGLAFKPDTDDLREAPSLELIEELVKEGALCRLYDPEAMEIAKRTLKNSSNFVWCSNPLEAAENADAIVLVTEWREFRFLDLSTLLKRMRGTVFFDGRNQYLPEDMKKMGWDYVSIGRSAVYQTKEESEQYVHFRVSSSKKAKN